ncbi:MAG: hypothetical protein ACO222_07050, partial [Polynucleobacter sp.]
VVNEAPPNHKPITTNQEPKKKATVVATPEGVSQQVWDEFVSHRKAKKAKVTELVVDGIKKQAELAGWSLEDALKEVVLRNWQSFKASWVQEKQSPADKRQNQMAQLTRGMSVPKAQPFWAKTNPSNQTVEVIDHVETKRLL